MTDNCYDEARKVLSMCKRVKNCTTVPIVPECSTPLSNLTRDVWNNMHLQGLAVEYDLVIASVPHFLYKQREMINYSRRPLVLSVKQHNTPSEEQLQSTKLFAILVSAHVQHRIISHSTHDMIITKFNLACQKHNSASKKELQSLCSLFHESLHSLITCASGHSLKRLLSPDISPDILFITEAGTREPITGYSTKTLCSWSSEHMESKLTNLHI